jgi:cytoskeletal protein CcmA (bactofilin family)
MAIFGKKTQSSPSAAPPPPAARSESETAYVGNKLAVKGRISGSGNLIIMGKLEGDFDMTGELVVAPSAVVNAEVKASSITVSGALTGNLTASEKIHLEKSAQVSGRMTSQRISIAEGALFNGEIEMKREKQDTQTWGSKQKAESPKDKKTDETGAKN